MKKDNKEKILEDLMIVMQIMIDRLDKEIRNLNIEDKTVIFRYLDLLARKDAINSLKSYLIGRIGDIKLPIPDEKYRKNI
jgi:hypothetical protein